VDTVDLVDGVDAVDGVDLVVGRQLLLLWGAVAERGTSGDTAFADDTTASAASVFLQL
jgi:hypothetical protein